MRRLSNEHPHLEIEHSNSNNKMVSSSIVLRTVLVFAAVVAAASVSSTAAENEPQLRTNDQLKTCWK